MKALCGIGLVVFLLVASASTFAEKQTLLNVSYDPTRELFKEINTQFAAEWKVKAGADLQVLQSHGGSGKQARSVIDGLEADVVTLALAYDIDNIARVGKLLPEEWQQRLPHNSAPYTSTIIFLVRKGNPKRIKDWDDLIRPDISVITPNPKTSGGARWNYLAAWGYALEHSGDDQQKAREFITQLFKNVPVLDTGSRGASTTFLQRGMGDVLLAWENEAELASKEVSGFGIERVIPSISILAEPAVALIDANVDRHKAREVAEAYLAFLYSQAGQEIAAKHYFRPRIEAAAKRVGVNFPALKLFTIERFGGWKKAQQEHFAEGGVFDQIYSGGN